MLRDQYSTIVVEADRTAVEDLVVKGAQADAVFGGIRATDRVPSDVSGLEGQVGVAELAVPAADGTAVFVDAEDHLVGIRVSFSACADLNPRHADSVEDVLVIGRFPLVFENLLSDSVDEFRACAEEVEELRGNPPSAPDFRMTERRGL